jgi:hypothetical protein
VRCSVRSIVRLGDLDTKKIRAEVLGQLLLERNREDEIVRDSN